MRTITFVAAIAAAIAGSSIPAGAAGTVEVFGAARSGSMLNVTGSATFTDQPVLVLGTDASGDAPTGFQQAGGDLTGVGLSSTLSDELKLRMTWNNGVTGGTPPLSFGWTFCVSGGSCYELNFQRLTFGNQNGLPTAGDSTLYRCATAACDPAGQTVVETGWIPVYFDGLGLTATLPGVLAATPGTSITSVPVDATGPAFSALGLAEPNTVQHGSGDGISTVAPYTVPRQEVAVAVGEAGQTPSSAAYGPSVTPDYEGRWTTSIDVSGVSGPKEIYVRACYGPNNCAYTSTPVSL